MNRRDFLRNTLAMTALTPITSLSAKIFSEEKNPGWQKGILSEPPELLSRKLEKTSAPVVGLAVKCQRASRLYSCGEEVVFEISGYGKIQVELSRDTAVVLKKQTAVLTKGKAFQIAGRLDEPGFLRCRVWPENSTAQKNAVHGAAGVDVERIRPYYGEPEDFDAFWQHAFAACRRIDPDVKVNYVKELSNHIRKVYSVDLAASGRRIYGWLSVPEGNGPFPGIVLVPGAGAGYNHPNLNWLHDNRLEDKVAMLVITVHPFPLPFQCPSLEKYVRDQYEGKGYFSSGLTGNPEDFFFYRLIPGAVRMAEWFAGQPFVDPERIVYHGGSQGGFMGHFLTAFSKVFKAAQFFIPSAYCDVGGAAADRHPAQSRIKAAADYAMSLRYYDSANAARRIRCPILAFIGFVDDTCFPSGVYAAYNALTCEKNVINMIDAGHAGDPRYAPFAMAFLREKLGLAAGEWV